MKMLIVALVAVALTCVVAAAPRAGESPADFSPPAVTIAPELVKDVFGGKPAKMVFCVRRDTGNPEHPQTRLGRYFLVDFSQPPFEPVKILDTRWKSPGRLGGTMADNKPHISPDGTRLVFEDGEGIQVCEFKAGGPGKTRIVQTDGFPVQPRWWVHPKTGDEYIIYCNFQKKNQYGARLHGFGPGKTMLQKLEKGGCKPQGAPTVLCDKYTFNAGRSPDGKYMCAGGSGWAIAEFKPEAVEDGLVKILKTGPEDRCNQSIAQGQDPKCPWRLMLWMDPGHRRIYFNPRIEKEWDKNEWEVTWGKEEAADGMCLPELRGNARFQISEWSTHPDFFTVLAGEGAYLYQFSKPDRNGKGNGWVKLAVHGQASADQGAYGKDFKGKIEGTVESCHLWVQPDGAKP